MIPRRSPSISSAEPSVRSRVPTRAELQAELVALRKRLAEAEETLLAIGRDEVDALVVVGREGGTEQVRTFEGADDSYRHLVETMRDGVVMVAEDGTILNSNRRFAELAARGDLVGKALGSLLEEDAALHTLLQNVGAETTVLEASLRRPHGAPVAVELSATALPLAGPRRVGIVVTRRAPEPSAALAAPRPPGASSPSRALPALLDHIGVGIVTVDARTQTITYSNRRAEEVLGRKLAGYAEPISHLELTAWRPDGTIVDPNRILIARVLSGEGRVREDLALVRGDGSILQTRAAAVPMSDEHGRLASILLTFDDATDEWRARTEREANERFRELFIGILGHDLRSPLSVLVVDANALQLSDGLGPNERRKVDRIASSASRMSRMVAQILDFTRARMGEGIPIDRQPMGLHDLVRNVVAESVPPKDAARVALAFEGNGIGDWDADRLAQVVSNLVGNALTHGAQNGVVHVSVRDEPACVRLAVHNEGRPIPEDLRRVIFDPFRRAATTQRTGGLGLGLYIAQKIVQAHGGTLTVESTAERGTTFTAVLPRAQHELPD
jgi:PAS domain S-box-containing protein